jgi:hypothetical protein
MKGGANMEVNHDMSDQELKTLLIDKYTDLQRIKKANGDTVNEELDYQIKVATAKLSSFEVNVEDLTL